jgi:hypothetical protein
MGCWNETCSLSGLAVRRGEKVKVLLISGKNNVLFYPFSGEYDDYGSIVNIEEDDNTGHIYKVLTEDGVSFKLCREDCQKESIEIEDFEGLVKAVERGFVRGNVWGRERTLGLVLIKEDVYNDSMKACGEFESYYGDETVDDVLKKEKDQAVKDHELSNSGMIMPNFHFLRINFCSPSHNDVGFAYEVDFDRALELSFEMRKLFGLYIRLRKDVDVVQVGRGSQDVDYEFWREMNGVFAKSCDDAEKKYEEDCG